MWNVHSSFIRKSAFIGTSIVFLQLGKLPYLVVVEPSVFDNPIQLPRFCGRLLVLEVVANKSRTTGGLYLVWQILTFFFTYNLRDEDDLICGNLNEDMIVEVVIAIEAIVI